MTHLSIKLVTSFFSFMAHGFISEKTYSKPNSTKPTMQLKDLKMTKAKHRANCKRFGVFFVESLNERPCNRSVCIELCVISSFIGYSLSH